MLKIKDKLKKIVKENHTFYDKIDTRYSLSLFNNSLKKLHNKFVGKRVFIIGNGPSLNRHDLSLLKDEYTFGVNGIFYKTDEVGFKPTFYVVEDPYVMSDNIEKINDYECQYKFFPQNYKSMVKNRKNVTFFTMDRGYYHPLSPYFSIPRFSADASHRLYCGQSVTMINIQLAYYLGFTEVYLIGMDHSYEMPKTVEENGVILSETDDVNHFHPEYFGKGKKWHDPHLDKVERTYQYYKLVYEAKNRNIYNATYGGNLEVFKRVEYLDLFAGDK